MKKQSPQIDHASDLSAWLTIVAEVEEARRSLKCEGDSCWFRGQADSTWGLTPGLIRPYVDERGNSPWKKQSATKKNRALKDLWNRESDLYWDASTRSPDLQDPGLSGWDVLFLMQHHGFPTRLLDWTEVLSVAMYFAVSSFDKYAKDRPAPAIWLLNPYSLNVESWGCYDVVDPRFLGWDNKEEEYYDYRDYMTHRYSDDYAELPVAVYPAQKSFRMRAQSGRFTIHGRGVDSLEVLCPEAVRKVVIPHEAVPDVRKFLVYAGVFEHVLFPDLDGMARSIRMRYGEYGRKPR